MVGLKAKIAVGLVGVLVVGGGAAAMFLSVPSAGVEDAGDWGEVTSERTEVVTTLWVNNQNPFGLNVNEGADAEYALALNGVELATGQKESVSIETGNNTVELRTFIDNSELSTWWVQFVRADETVELNVTGTVHVSTPLGGTDVSIPPVERTMLTDSTPIIDSLSSAVAATEGSYTSNETVGTELGGGTAVVGVEVVDASARWGEVNESTTVMLLDFTLHNPSETVPFPAVPDGMTISIDMNEVRLFEASEDEAQPRDVGPDAVIQPGETRTVTIAVTMANEEIDDWFTSHVRNGEVSEVDAKFRFVFEEPNTGTTIRIPEDKPVTYSCEMQTAILVDGQETDSTCGEGGTVGA